MSQKKDTPVLFKNTTFAIARELFSKPNKTFHLRKLAKETGLSTTAVDRSVHELMRSGSVEAIKTDLTTNIKANLSSEHYRAQKVILNLFLLEHYKLVQVLQETFHPKTIVLFGSYAKGKQTNWSDFDLCIVSSAFEKKIKNPMNYLWSKRLAVNDFTIEPVGFSPSDFAEESPLISEIKKYGIMVR